MLTYGSVCSGIESASVAWEPLGFKPLWLSEIEPFPCAVLNHHWPHVQNLGDMTTLPNLIRKGLIEAPDVLVGGTPCFTAGHMVLTERGHVPIEDILPGDRVVTHKGRLKTVIRVGSKSANVGMLNGVGCPQGIETTPDHPFLAINYQSQSTKRQNKYCRVEHFGDIEWVPADKMKGLQWCSLTNLGIPCGESYDAELMYLAGFYLGEGFIRKWSGKNKKAVVFGINETKLNKLQSIIKRFHLVITQERTGPRVTINNTKLAEWLFDNFKSLSHAKTIPSWVHSHPNRKALLAGYLDTDGTKVRNGWRANSTSKSLAYGINQLACTLGFTASVGFTKTDNTCVIEGRTVNQKDYWTVSAYDSGFSRKSRLHEGLLLRKVSGYTDSSVSKTVYNIEIEDDHSYTVNGFIVHNCQAFSVAGKRESLDDSRGQLTLTYVEILNAIDEQREIPAICVWENVPGVLNTKDNAFGCFLGALSGSGCELQPSGSKWGNAGCVFGPQRAVAWRVIDAQYFGVAQRRRRVFVVASARDGFDPSKILFECEGVRRDSPPSREARKEVAGNVSNSVGTWCARSCRAVGVQEAESGHLIVSPYQEISHCLNAGGMGRQDYETESFVIHGTQDPCVSNNLAFTLGRNGGAENAIFGIPGNWIGRKPENGGNAVEPMNNISPCQTVTDRHAVAYKSVVRRLTPTECERLQGFPDGHTLIPESKRKKLDDDMKWYLQVQRPDVDPTYLCSDGPRYKAIGNSKAVPCIKFIGLRLLYNEFGLL